MKFEFVRTGDRYFTDDLGGRWGTLSHGGWLVLDRAPRHSRV